LGGVDLFIHYHGAYHSDYFESMVWYLKQYAPQAQIITLSTQLQDDLSQLETDEEGRRKASFVLATPPSMTRTH
ncbi:MAG: iron-regulated protein, partial [Bacteroidetes bacterium]|nr:iron-regulated protein [Bacteroidota bacterium]